MTTDHNELHLLLPDRDLPGARHDQLREFLMHEIQSDRTAAPAVRRRPLRRLAPVLAAGLAVAVAITVVGLSLGRSPGSGPTSSTREAASPDSGSRPEPRVLVPVAQTFELAALSAESQPFMPPRPDQWIYIKQRNLHPSAVAKDKGMDPDRIEETWWKADGTQTYEFIPEIEKYLIVEEPNGYPDLLALPTDPEAVLSLFRDLTTWVRLPGEPQPGQGRDGAYVTYLPAPEDGDVDGAVFGRIARILASTLLPPDVTAALWRAASLIPAVVQAEEPVQIDGRTAIAIGRVQGGWQFEQLLVDPETYEFVGYRSVAIKDHTYTSPGGEVTETAGTEQFALIRLAASIVDDFGHSG
jgi:hypothetical protein